MKFVRFSSESLGFRALVVIGTRFFTFKSATSGKIAAFRICLSWQQIHIAAILPQYCRNIVAILLQYFDFAKGNQSINFYLRIQCRS